MRSLVRTRFFMFLAVVAPCALGLAGCGQSSMVLKGQVDKLQQQQVALTRQNEQLQNRATSLDRDNQELDRLLAQSTQREKILDEQIVAVRGQLSDAATQLAKAREASLNSEKQVKAMTASMERQGRVTINPNSSVRNTLPTINLPGVDVRRDGEVIRIALPAERLFDPGAAQLRSDATTFLSQVAAEVQRTYPQQMIGVEGHTDSNPPTLAGYRNVHELSVAWAVAVYNHLGTQTRLQPKQLVVTGHGANCPAYSNDSAGGAQRNRRVELVIYPDRVS
jgi:flagellar motor protein MotB